MGHVALVTDEDEMQGIYAEIMTVPGGVGYWLDHALRGIAWDYLPDVQLVVSYLENDDSNEKTPYTATIIDCDLDKFLLCVTFDGVEVDPNDPEDGGPTWVSLLHDEWKWTDCAPPKKAEVKRAHKEHMERLKEARQASAEGGGGGGGGGGNEARRASGGSELDANGEDPSQKRPKKSHHKKLPLPHELAETGEVGEGEAAEPRRALPKGLQKAKAAATLSEAEVYAALSEQGKFTSQMAKAARQVMSPTLVCDSDSVPGVNQAVATLRAGSTHGALFGLVTLHELKVLPALLQLLQPGRVPLDLPDSSTLIENVLATLVRAAAAQPPCSHRVTTAWHCIP